MIARRAYDPKIKNAKLSAVSCEIWFLDCQISLVRSSFVFDRVSNLMVRTISARRLFFDFLIL
jgi:hypothetical protein